MESGCSVNEDQHAHPFTFGKGGKKIKLKSAKQALRSATRKIVNLIQKQDTIEKRVALIRNTLDSKEIKTEIGLTGMFDKQQDNINRFLCKLYEKDIKRGQIGEVKKKTMEIIVASCIGTPKKNATTGHLEMVAEEKQIVNNLENMSRTSGIGLMERAMVVRHGVMTKGEMSELVK